MKNLIEAAIQANDIGQDYAVTIRSDASAILESLVGDLKPDELDRALLNQGFKLSSSYHTTLRMLAEAARERRTRRQAAT